MSSHECASFVSPLDLAAASWSPLRFLGPAGVAIQASRSGRTVEEIGGEVIEGWRASESPGTLDYDPRLAATPVYRPGNIGKLRLVLGERHWAVPQIEGRWCVQPGDVVLGKFAPIRAALVPPHAKRHPVDGNSLIVRRLPAVESAWAAVCLNTSPYESVLLENAGPLRRTSGKAVGALRLPAAPAQMEGLAVRLREALDAEALVGEAFQRLRLEASEFARSVTSEVRVLSPGASFPPAAVSHDSWLPSATALRAEQAALADEGWMAVDELGSSGPRERLGQLPNSGRVLRLSDVERDLFVPGVTSDGEFLPGRTLAGPLVPGEVLLSTLGSSFRVAYVDEDVRPHTYASDGWVRWRFRETPAAWALLLSVGSVAAQATRLAVGSVQQFVPPDALRTLRLPFPPREVREQWQSSIERHHARRRVLEREWWALMNELSAVFDAVHRPFRTGGPDTKGDRG